MVEVKRLQGPVQVAPAKAKLDGKGGRTNGEAKPFGEPSIDHMLDSSHELDLIARKIENGAADGNDIHFLEGEAKNHNPRALQLLVSSLGNKDMAYLSAFAIASLATEGIDLAPYTSDLRKLASESDDEVRETIGYALGEQIAFEERETIAPQEPVEPISIRPSLELVFEPIVAPEEPTVRAAQEEIAAPLEEERLTLPPTAIEAIFDRLNDAANEYTKEAGARAILRMAEDGTDISFAYPVINGLLLDKNERPETKKLLLEALSFSAKTGSVKPCLDGIVACIESGNNDFQPHIEQIKNATKADTEIQLAILAAEFKSLGLLR